MGLTELLFLGIGLLLGGLTLFIIYKNRLSSEKKLSAERINDLNRSIEEEKVSNDKKEQVILDLTKRISTRESDYKHLNDKMLEQKEEIGKIQEKFHIEFRNLANDILEEKTKKFTEQNSIRLGEILNPLNQKIKDFEKKIEETYDKETQQRVSLKEEVKRLAELNQIVSKEASNLTKALKGEAKTQGNWGEVILENILEQSGLVKNREYFVQPSFTNESGSRLQPDIVITYPGERSVIIDSKVSLTAFERYITAESEEKKEIALKDHLISVKNHVKELAGKSYHEISQLKALDFVMMFLPVEPAYYLAIQEDPELWNFAYDKRILLISPTNLIASLKMIESMWRQEYQNKNVMEIARQSGALYDKFVGLISDLSDLGKRLDSAKIHYTLTMNKLSEGKGSLVSKVEQIKKLGAKTKKTLPQDLMQKALEEDDE